MAYFVIDNWMCSHVLHIDDSCCTRIGFSQAFHADLEKRKEVYCCRLGGCIITIHLNTQRAWYYG